jgi:DoxX-like family
MSSAPTLGEAASPTFATALGPAVWMGRVMSSVVVAFLLFDGAIKVLDLPIVGETLERLGYSANLARGLGLLTLAIAILYAVPRTAFLGAVLLTGLLGGAMATHLRVGSPVFTHLLFGLYLGLLAWAGLFLRDPQVRALMPVRRVRSVAPPASPLRRET